MEIPTEVQGLVITAALTLFTTIVGLIAFAGRKLIDLGGRYLEAKIGLTQTQWLKEQAKTVVYKLEQHPYWSTFDGAKKKEMGILWLSEQCKKAGFNVSTQMIDDAIEEAVKTMNMQIPEIGELLGNFIEDEFDVNVGDVMGDEE